MSAKEFGPNLDRARREAGMTLRDLGAAAGTGHSYVHRVIHGKMCPSLEAAERLAKAVNCSLASLLEPNGKKSRHST